MSRRALTLDGVSYLADREALVREGGASGPDRWYAVVLDPEHGACIDERVPEGYFPTMRACHDAIRKHHQASESQEDIDGWTSFALTHFQEAIERKPEGDKDYDA